MCIVPDPALLVKAPPPGGPPPAPPPRPRLPLVRSTADLARNHPDVYAALCAAWDDGPKAA